MTPMTIKISNKEDKEPIWPGITVDNMVDAGVLSDVAILEGGMASGNPSVMFHIPMPNGMHIIAQQTAKQMVTLARILMAKYPNLMD